MKTKTIELTIPANRRNLFEHKLEQARVPKFHSYLMSKEHNLYLARYSFIIREDDKVTKEMIYNVSEEFALDDGRISMDKISATVSIDKLSKITELATQIESYIRSTSMDDAEDEEEIKPAFDALFEIKRNATIAVQGIIDYYL